MKPENVYQILLVRAVEEDDPRGDRLPLSSREEAARRAGEIEQPADPGPEARLRGRDWRFMARRAAYLAPLASGLARVSPHPPALGGAVCFGIAAAFLLGAASHTAGLAHAFHLFAGPFLFLLLWNLLVVGLVIFRLFWPKPAAAKPAWTLRLLAWWQETRAGGREAPLLGRHFLARWLESGWPALKAGLAAFFHAASVAFALGLVASVYARGLSSQYAAGWESTWLDANQVERLLGTVLHPASMVTGIPLPADTRAWEELRFSRAGTGVPAGNWIHLHAVTLGLFAVLPRALFGLLAWFNARRLGRKPPPWPPGDAYARRILGGARAGGGTVVDIVAYGFKSTALLTNGRYKDMLARLCSEVWGREAMARWSEPLAYGAEIPAREMNTAAAGTLLLFDIRATPENEVHGEILAAFKNGAPGQSLLCAVETAGFPEERLPARLAAWSELARARSVELLTLDEGLPATRRAPADHLIRL